MSLEALPTKHVNNEYNRGAFDEEMMICKVKENVRLTCELEYFRGKIFKNGRSIHRRLRSDANVMLCALLQVTVDTTNGEL